MTRNHSIADNRIPIVDFLRGFALLGVIVSNFMSFQDKSISDPGLNKIPQALEIIFFGPVWIVLSFLFGFGFWKLLQKSRKGNSIFPLFAQRMFWLFVIGCLNACIFHIDILRDFAVIGMFLLITPYIDKKKLLGFAIFMTLLIPLIRALTVSLDFHGAEAVSRIYPLFSSKNLLDIIQFNLEFIKIVQIQNPVYLIAVHFEMFCFFLWGVLTARSSFFSSKYLRLYAKRILVISLGIMLLIFGLRYFSKPLSISISKIYNLKILTEIVYAVFTFSIVILVYISGYCQKVFRYVEIYGKMTLTNYIAQSIFSLFLFSGFGLGIGRDQPVWIYFSIAVSIYFLQSIISFHWSKKFLTGPVEWAWRSVSSRRKLRLKK